MTAAYWVWFGVAWLFIAAVALSRWHASERRDADATEAALRGTRQNTSHQYEMDAM